MALWFEALPSPRAASADRLQGDLDRLTGCRDVVDRILVPEVVDGTHQTVDAFDFAAAARKHTGLPAGAAVLTQSRDAEALKQRVQHGRALGLDRFLLVGPPRRGQPTATGVEDGLRLVGNLGDTGVVTIPTRRRWRVDEPHRLLAKQRAGASFCLSQILFDEGDALDVRRDFVQSLAPGEDPLPTIVSVAPVRRARDLPFLEGLGVRFPPRLHRALRTGSDAERSRLSRDAALQTVRNLVAHHRDEGLGPIGVCVTHVMVSNVEAAIDLAAAVRDDLRSLHAPALVA